MTRAVFFDVDFTLIHPGPTFLGAGYRTFCARYGIEVDPAKFEQAVIAAAPCLDTDDDRYTDELFVVYTRRIVERTVDEIEDLLALVVSVQSLETLLVDAWLGRVRGILIEARSRST